MMKHGRIFGVKPKRYSIATPTKAIQFGIINRKNMHPIIAGILIIPHFFLGLKCETEIGTPDPLFMAGSEIARVLCWYMTWNGEKYLRKMKEWILILNSCHFELESILPTDVGRSISFTVRDSHALTCTHGRTSYQNKEQRSSDYNTHRGSATIFTAQEASSLYVST